MHGIVMVGLREFVLDAFDERTWELLKREATDRTDFYLPLQTYPDEELLRLVEVAVERLEIPQDDLLFSFGAFLVGSLSETYNAYLDDRWDALDLLANTESVIHTALRDRTTGEFRPPALRTERVDEDTVVVEYTSNRQICPFARGLIDGLGEQFGEELVLEEPLCMQAGDDRCKFVVTRAHGS